MAQANNNQTTTAKSTQNSILISEIRDGIVIMRDGSLRGVILSSAINFDLMSRQEQDAVEYAFQGFLNSLHFPIQIVVRSQKIDLDDYLEKLQALRAEQSNELLGFLMDDYLANIRGLVEEVNIMDKQFYVVVPYFPPLSTVKNGNIATNIRRALSPRPVITVSDEEFKQYKTELGQRVALVSGGMAQMGIRAASLNSQELIDLYYSIYNPDTAQSQKLIDSGQLQTAVVTKGEGNAPHNPLPGAPL